MSERSQYGKGSSGFYRLERPGKRAESIGVYEEDDDGYDAAKEKEKELKEENYDTEEEVRVRIEDAEIHRRDSIDGAEIDMVMRALSGSPVVSSAECADKIERILRKYL